MSAQHPPHAPRSVRQAVAETSAALQRANVDNPRLDARILLAHVLGADTNATFLRGDTILSVPQEAALAHVVKRRAAREPVSRIVGRREFWGLPFALSPHTLDPRPDTEVLVSAVLEHRGLVASDKPRILDLGTGSGCILLALLKEWPQAVGVGLDVSFPALVTARKNAANLALAERSAFVCANWTAALAGPFDVLVSNPPYLSQDDLSHLQPEVRFDPHAALDGGSDGLDVYRAVIPGLTELCAPESLIAFEVGQGQASSVAAMLESAGFRVVEIRSDLASIPRCVVAQNKA
ncbi:MAG: peptide chain release factor N(5)-glutamine methyltransferase [Rhodospirillaceae bacterium]|nr:peptide chain release factor N(5)-glutamine methyltransferase [Rhodospirillaceae bacterium]